MTHPLIEKRLEILKQELEDASAEVEESFNTLEGSFDECFNFPIEDKSDYDEARRVLESFECEIDDLDNARRQADGDMEEVFTIVDKMEDLDILEKECRTKYCNDQREKLQEWTKKIKEATAYIYELSYRDNVSHSSRKIEDTLQELHNTLTFGSALLHELGEKSEEFDRAWEAGNIDLSDVEGFEDLTENDSED